MPLHQTDAGLFPVFAQVPPLPIYGIKRGDLFPPPKRRHDIGGLLEIYKPINVVPLRESVHQLELVLVEPTL